MFWEDVQILQQSQFTQPQGFCHFFSRAIKEIRIQERADGVEGNTRPCVVINSTILFRHPEGFTT